MPHVWNAYRCGHAVRCESLQGAQAHLEPGIFSTVAHNTAYCDECIEEEKNADMAELEAGIEALGVKSVYIPPTSQAYDIAAALDNLELKTSVQKDPNVPSASIKKGKRKADDSLEDGPSKKTVKTLEANGLKPLTTFKIYRPRLGEIAPIFWDGVRLLWGNQTVPAEIPYRATLLLPGGLEEFAAANWKPGKPACNAKALLSEEDTKAECMRLIEDGFEFETQLKRDSDDEGKTAYWAFFWSESKRLGVDGDEAFTMMCWRMKVAWTAFYLKNRELVWDYNR